TRTLLHSFLRSRNRGLNVACSGTNLFAVVVQRFFHLIDKSIQTVPRLDLLALPRIFRRMRLSVAHHPVDLVLCQSRRGSDGDLLFTTRTHVFSRHVNDAVCVNIKGHLYLRHTTRRRRNTNEVELAQGSVVPRHWTLTL